MQVQALILLVINLDLMDMQAVVIQLLVLQVYILMFDSLKEHKFIQVILLGLLVHLRLRVVHIHLLQMLIRQYQQVIQNY